MRHTRRGDDSRRQAALYNRAINAVEDQIGKVLREPPSDASTWQLLALYQRLRALVRAFHVSIGAVEGTTEARGEANAYTRETVAKLVTAWIYEQMRHA